MAKDAGADTPATEKQPEPRQGDQAEEERSESAAAREPATTDAEDGKREPAESAEPDEPAELAESAEPAEPDEPAESGRQDEPDSENATPNRDTDPAADADADPAPDTGGDRDEEAAAASPASPAPAGSARRRHLATAVTVVGELLITAGVVLGLFVVYSLWWTNVLANREAQRDSDAIRDFWDEAPAAEAEEEPVPREYDPSDGIGFLHAPTMTGSDILIKEGTDLDTLNGGVAGYYLEPTESAMPWDEEGNFSIAAHRDGHGAKFHNIQRIEEGDPLVFETQDTWYIYETYAILPETSRYNTGVLDPIPEESGATEAGRYITLTTCTPVYTSEYRYIVWGELQRTEPVDELRTPPQELLDAS